ncbi:glucosamine-6-phosphate deaminase [Niallia sp. NCCP-28]|uniref:glucosamine-6-phosphate deaminase n=1 Tax=Niallia sp. NCCP-28 TaxID=2934712 RepID=UPI00207ED121|nr:glucosamine-6-phosphate deaminase [Niallia sp. NCCP-28]GKU81880.1 glucosamine-6-phosphate deaminase 1 [Niallia sp. NCCP-28]
MKLIETANYETMSQTAAALVIQQVKSKPNTVLGLATGGTPVGMYQYLKEDYEQNQTSYQNVHTVNLDEYVGLSKEDSKSYAYYMNDHLFKHIHIPLEQTFLPVEEQGDNYEELIASLGGIDLQILGIGGNGHIGFNEPGTPFTSKTGIVQLTESTREANARYFSSMDEVPTHAISMGISTIMQSKNILLLVSGSKKAEILYRLLTEDVDEALPASILKTHSNVTIIADQDALSVLKEKEGSVFQ